MGNTDFVSLNIADALSESVEGPSGSLEVKSAESGLKPEEDPSESSFFYWNTVEETTAHYS